MAKMSDSAAVRMNAALSCAVTTDLDKVRAYDLTQAAVYALRAGIADLDARGMFWARREDGRSADEEKRVLLVKELRRRGERVAA